MSLDYNDEFWEDACLCDQGHKLVDKPVKSVVRYEVFPREISFFGKNNFLLDFGKEIVGCVRFNGIGKKGTRLRVLCGEELVDTGHVRYDMRCNVLYEDNWTLSGNTETIENFAYKGFRYLEVETEGDSIDPSCFSVMAQHYPIEKKSVFHCNDEDIQGIWDICENAVIISTQEAYVDCPTREKGQYLGDMLVTGLAHCYITSDGEMYKKALWDFANTAFICKGLLAVAPGGTMQEIAD